MKKNVSTAKKTTKSNGHTNTEQNENTLLDELFHDELKDIYWAEKHLLKALPKLQKAATSEELQNALAEHLEVTREHVSRLENVFEILGHKPQAKKCDAMEGLTKEGEKAIEDTDDGTATRDVALIIAAQKVEHYEIAAYGSLTQLAKTMGKDDVKEILGQTLNEEKEADEKLTDIAENSVNYESAQEAEA